MQITKDYVAGPSVAIDNLRPEKAVLHVRNSRYYNQAAPFDRLHGVYVRLLAVKKLSVRFRTLTLVHKDLQRVFVDTLGGGIPNENNIFVEAANPPNWQRPAQRHRE